MSAPPPSYDAAHQHPPQGVTPVMTPPQGAPMGQDKTPSPYVVPMPEQPQPIPMQPMTTQNASNSVVPLHLLSEKAEWIDCHFCKQRTQTRVDRRGEGLQILTGFLLCLVCICLTPLPCCLGWFEEVHWYCTNCKKEVAYKAKDMPIQVIPPPEARVAQSQFPGPRHPGPQSPGPQSQPMSPQPMSPQYQQPMPTGQAPPMGQPQSPPLMQQYPPQYPPQGVPQGAPMAPNQ